MQKTPQIHIIIALAGLIGFSVLFSACSNPFAPGLSDIQNENAVLGDQKTVEGLFQNFKYSYIFQDTVVYGKLIAADFTFSHKPYDLDDFVTWGRDEEMASTASMFRGTQRLNLVWFEISQAITDTIDGVIMKDIYRNYSLTVSFSASDQVSVDGTANFLIVRKDASEDWQILRWRDASF
ncbi:MAG: hypothetical protein PF588_01765 [Candidatus Kapabacteria bacterium]|nr:hypothetical protein [Candidatus Kapabacteria bacterium]